MDRNMADFSGFPDIMDAAVKDISKRVAKLTVQSTDGLDWDTEDSYSVLATTQGDYVLTLVFCTDGRVLHKIARNMKHGMEASEEDIPIYVTEFFNILCGHIVSAMNNKCHCKARFGIPQIINGLYEPVCPQEPPCPECRHEYFYHCDDGIIKVETLCKCS